MKIDRQTLRKTAKELGLRIPEVQLLCAQERFLARVMSVPEGHNFVWKGGSLILRAYQTLEIPRYTVDIDLLVQNLKIENAQEAFQSACKIDLDDGFQFGNITVEEMQRETPYGGFRYEIEWTYDGRPGAQSLKIDVCAGDYVKDEKHDLNEVAFFVEEELSIQIYPAEYIFAEKMETILRFGTGNSRLKDFIDLWSLSKRNMDNTNLASAVSHCFERRDTKLDLDKIYDILNDKIFVDSFSQQLKKASIKRLNLPPLEKIFGEIQDFINSVPFQRQ